MGAYITYSDTLPRFYDTRKITLDKILQALNNGAGGGGGGGVDGHLVGAGAPSGGIGSSGDTYWDTTGKDFYVKDGSSWTLLVDLAP